MTYSLRHAESDQGTSEASTTGLGAVAAQAGAGIDLLKPAAIEGDEKLMTDAEDMNR